jgi:hypothetical protein
MQRTRILLACTLLLVAAGLVAGLVVLAVAKEEDSTPPVISEVSARLVAHDDVAVITWMTDEPATAMVSYRCARYYSIASPLEYSSIAHRLDGPLFSTSHVICLGHEWRPLEPDTTYTYTVTSVDRAGNEAVSDEHTFTTRPHTSGAL